MTVKRLFVSLAAAFALAAPALAQGTSPCLGPEDAHAVAAMAIGPVVSAATQRCRAGFPGQAPALASRGERFAARFADEGDAAIDKLGPRLFRDLAPNLAASPSPALRALTRQFLVETLTAQLMPRIDARTCSVVDLMLPTIEPLTDGQVVDLVGAALTAGLLIKGDDSPIRFCKTTA